MAARRDDPFAGTPWLKKGTSSGKDKWDDNSLLVQTIDEMKAQMGADSAYSVVIGVGSAIAAAAARTGSQINAQDTTLLAQVLASLGPTDRKAIASGNSEAVRGKVDALIEHQAQVNKQAKLAVNIHGPGADRQRPGVGRTHGQAQEGRDARGAQGTRPADQGTQAGTPQGERCAGPHRRQGKPEGVTRRDGTSGG